MTSNNVLASILMVLAMGAGAEDPPAVDAGLQAVASLGQANGQALACGDHGAAAHAKELMLQHAPRTARYGGVFEQATQEGYLSQIKSRSSCPSPAELAVRIESISMLLRQALPQGE